MVSWIEVFKMWVLLIHGVLSMMIFCTPTLTNPLFYSNKSQLFSAIVGALSLDEEKLAIAMEAVDAEEDEASPTRSSKFDDVLSLDHFTALWKDLQLAEKMPEGVFEMLRQRPQFCRKRMYISGV